MDQSHPTVITSQVKTCWNKCLTSSESMYKLFPTSYTISFCFSNFLFITWICSFVKLIRWTQSFTWLPMVVMGEYREEISGRTIRPAVACYFRHIARPPKRNLITDYHVPRSYKELKFFINSIINAERLTYGRSVIFIVWFSNV